MNNMDCEELIKDYFDDPSTRAVVETDLGKYDKIDIDWGTRKIAVKGPLARKVWDLDDTLRCLQTLKKAKVFEIDKCGRHHFNT